MKGDWGSGDPPSLRKDRQGSMPKGARSGDDESAQNDGASDSLTWGNSSKA